MTVYFIGMEDTDFVKIGYTRGKVYKRLAALQTSCPANLKVLYMIRDGKERIVHEMAKAYRIRGEWYRMNHDELLSLLIRLQNGVGWTLSVENRETEDLLESWDDFLKSVGGKHEIPS